MESKPESVTYDWRIGYTFFLVLISIAASNATFPAMLYIFVINWLLWYFPALLLVRAFKPVSPTTPAEPPS